MQRLATHGPGPSVDPQQDSTYPQEILSISTAFSSMPTGVEVIAVAVAIATLTSGFNDGVELIKKVLAKWRENRTNKTNKAELEKLQQSLMLARSTVQGAYDEPRQRLGQRFSTGDGEYISLLGA
jgi:hypothetical protein